MKFMTSMRAFVADHSGILAVLVLAGLIRFAYWIELRSDPEMHGPRLDGLYHHYWAQALLSGDWTPPPGERDPMIPDTPYFRPPGYPWIVAAIYAAAGKPSASALWMVQMIMGLATVLTVYRMGFRCWGKWAGMIAAALFAGAWQNVYFEGTWLETAPLTLLLTVSTLLVARFREKPTAGRAIATGAALGAAVLIRPNALLLTPLFLVWLWAPRIRKKAFRAIFLRSLLIPAMLSALLLTTLIRNWKVSGEWVLVSSNAGINLLLGTEYDSTVSHGNWLTENWSCFDAPEIVARLSDLEDRPLGHGEASALLAREAWSIHRQDLRQAARLFFWKTLLFWAPSEIPSNESEQMDRDHSPVLRRLPVRFAPLLALAFLGAWIAAPRRIRETDDAGIGNSFELAGLLTGIIGVYFASFLPFVLAGQYRVPLIPFLSVFGGIAVDDLRVRLGHRNWKRAGIRGAWMLGLLALVRANPTDLPPDAAHWHYMRAQRFARSGETEREEAEYRKALAVNPTSAENLLNLGILLFESDELRESSEMLTRSISVRESARGNLYLGRILDRAGQGNMALAHYRAAEALDHEGLAEIPYRIGHVLMEKGRATEAGAAFERALVLDPDFHGARFGLGWAALQSGRPDEALREFQRLREMRIPNPAILYQGGRALRALGRTAEARDWWSAYLRQVPEDDEVLHAVEELGGNNP